MSKINIISGFLGAGKTTFIQKLLKEVFTGEKIVIIENEFGEIGIDAGFLKNAGVQITEMNSGCICCSLVGDFGASLKEVKEKFSPDRIIIEPSGVGKLSDVIKAVQNVQNEAELIFDSSMTVADSTKCKIYMKNFGEFYNNQIEHADTIVLSRTQNLSQDKLEKCVSTIRTKNNKASIITTPWEQLQGSHLLEAMEKASFEEKTLAEELAHSHPRGNCPQCQGEHNHEHEHHHGCGHHHEHEHHNCGHHHEHEHHHGCGHHHEHEHHHDCGHHHEHEHHHDCGHHHEHEHHHAEEIFTSWGQETVKKYSKEELSKILASLSEEDYGIILRAKGILPDTEGNWMYFDFVPGEYEIRQGKPDYTGKICVIGSKLHTDALAALFSLIS